MSQFIVRQPGEKWEARITPAGRWSWYISYHRGLSTISTEWRGMAFGGRQRAEAKARRALAKLQRDDDRLDATFTIR